MENTAETNAPEPAETKRAKWWVIVLVIVLFVVLGFCVWVLVGPAVGNVYEQVMTAMPWTFLQWLMAIILMAIILKAAKQGESAAATRTFAPWLGREELVMEELKPEELEDLVRELEGESDEEEALSPEMERLLRRLGPWSPDQTRRDAAAQLGRVATSNPHIVQALIKACESPSDLVSAAAAKSLRAPVHQECLQQHPELATAAESALQQAPSADWLQGTLSGQGRATSVQQRIYPGFRIQERPLLGRLMGVPFALFGLGALLGAAVGATVGIDLKVLILGVFGLVFTYVGLYVIGLDLKELLFALLHRGAWRGQQVTADGRITDRDIVEHEDKYGRVSYTYWITFDFPTTEGLVRLKTRVDERRYGQLRRRQPVKVRYAQENPRLAILEWESGW